MRLIELRQYLHKHPELSGEEYKTHDYLKTYLHDELNLDAITVAKTGLVVVFDSGVEGVVTLFRGDIDGLPIVDDIDEPYKSTREAVGHKCGHDGHTTIMVGLCERLKDSPPEAGKVLILFQPAEETGEGAKKVLEDEFFQSLQLDYAFALHNIPGYPKGDILWKYDIFSASVISCSIDIKGATAHAATPWTGRNPSHLIARIFDYTEDCNRETYNKDGLEVITPIFAQIGKTAYGISAGKGTVHFTLRAIDQQAMEALQKKFQSYVEEEADKRNLELSWKWFEEFYANDNDREAVDVLKAAAKAIDMNLVHLHRPFRWGEDFGLINEVASKGCMFGLGAGEDTPPLHDQAFDFPDDIIEPGVDIFFSIYKTMYA